MSAYVRTCVPTRVCVGLSERMSEYVTQIAIYGHTGAGNGSSFIHGALGERGRTGGFAGTPYGITSGWTSEKLQKPRPM